MRHDESQPVLQSPPSKPTDYKLIYHNLKSLQTKRKEMLKKGTAIGSEFPPLSKSAVLIAVSPGYLYDWETLSLTLEHDHKNPFIPNLISGLSLAAFKNLPPPTVVHIVGGYGATAPQFAAVLGISRTQPKEYKTFEDILREGQKRADEQDQAWNEREQKAINLIFKNRSQEKGKQKDNVHLTSELRKDPAWIELRKEMGAVYEQQKTLNHEVQDEFKIAVDNFVKPAMNRIFKDLFYRLKIPEKNIFYSMVVDQGGRPYSIENFIYRLMIVHALDEMSDCALLGQQHNLDYVLHVGYARKEKVDSEVAELLKLTMKLFLRPSFHEKMQWLRIGFDPISPVKSLDDSASSTDSETNSPSSTDSEDSFSHSPQKESSLPLEAKRLPPKQPFMPQSQPPPVHLDQPSPQHFDIEEEKNMKDPKHTEILSTKEFIDLLARIARSPLPLKKREKMVGALGELASEEDAKRLECGHVPPEQKEVHVQSTIVPISSAHNVHRITTSVKPKPTTMISTTTSLEPGR